ncbi:hypothetical protein BURPS1710b_A1125 [Burkholderia pseudomallei 1710b]|uniref:Uncharacterized protein n=1 Tax=Burkholderia pseudomallei (strain 1710b) TaxID=320372 RepID=Q3JJH1_BURP1|nr:hypothetical protein BURPS1710b_A1125 [Burkholderia pseudomallei 1710b]
MPTRPARSSRHRGARVRVRIRRAAREGGCRSCRRAGCRVDRVVRARRRAGRCGGRRRYGRDARAACVVRAACCAARAAGCVACFVCIDCADNPDSDDSTDRVRTGRHAPFRAAARTAGRRTAGRRTARHRSAPLRRHGAREGRLGRHARRLVARRGRAEPGKPAGAAGGARRARAGAGAAAHRALARVFDGAPDERLWRLVRRAPARALSGGRPHDHRRARATAPLQRKHAARRDHVHPGHGAGLVRRHRVFRHDVRHDPAERARRSVAQPQAAVESLARAVGGRGLRVEPQRPPRSALPPRRDLVCGAEVDLRGGLELHGRFAGLGEGARLLRRDHLRRGRQEPDRAAWQLRPRGVSGDRKQRADHRFPQPRGVAEVALLGHPQVGHASRVRLLPQPVLFAHRRRSRDVLPVVTGGPHAYRSRSAARRSFAAHARASSALARVGRASHARAVRAAVARAAVCVAILARGGRLGRAAARSFAHRGRARLSGACTARVAAVDQSRRADAERHVAVRHRRGLRRGFRGDIRAPNDMAARCVPAAHRRVRATDDLHVFLGDVRACRHGGVRRRRARRGGARRVSVRRVASFERCVRDERRGDRADSARDGRALLSARFLVRAEGVRIAARAGLLRARAAVRVAAACDRDLSRLAAVRAVLLFRARRAAADRAARHALQLLRELARRVDSGAALNGRPETKETAAYQY